MAHGEYVSTSEVVREALRDWQFRRSLHQKELEKGMPVIRRTAQAEADLILYRIIPDGIEVVRGVQGSRRLENLFP